MGQNSTVLPANCDVIKVVKDPAGYRDLCGAVGETA